jgi:hypothetical protein
MARKLWQGRGVRQFSFCIGRIQFLNWQRWRRRRSWLNNERRRQHKPPYVSSEIKNFDNQDRL